MNEAAKEVLSPAEPLYEFLAEEVLGNVLGFKHLRPVFDVYALDTSSTIFRYSDRRTFINLVGKFYGNKWLHGSQSGEDELRARLMQREFDNLERVRALGLNAYPHQVVRPLAVSASLNCILVEEFAPGFNLDFHIREARDHGLTDQLLSAITDVAWFLADLHTRSQTRSPVEDEPVLIFFQKIVGELSYWRIISTEEEGQLTELGERWQASGLLCRSQQVLTHGDVTPSNFIWRGEHELTVIDLERLYLKDRTFDTGCFAAELKHLFGWYWHAPHASEFYLQHFYASYAAYLPPGEEDFSSLTTRSRFYMGLHELRISRNDWLHLEYRQQLIKDAFECLKI